MKIPINKAPSPLQSPFAVLDASRLGELPDYDGPPPSDPIPATAKGKETLKLRKEKSGRGGKVVIVVHGFSDRISEAAIADLLSVAKKSLGLGGRVSEREIEIQTSEPQRIRAFLEDLGHRVKGP